MGRDEITQGLPDRLLGMVVEKASECGKQVQTESGAEQGRLSELQPTELIFIMALHLAAQGDVIDGPQRFRVEIDERDQVRHELAKPMVLVDRGEPLDVEQQFVA